jgi:hypothetical protein
MPSLKRSLSPDSENDYPSKSAKLNKYDRALKDKTGLARIDILETRLLQSYQKVEDLEAQALVNADRIKDAEAQNLQLLGFMSKNQQSLPNGKWTPQMAVKVSLLNLYFEDIPYLIRAQLEAFPAAKHAADTRLSIDQEYSLIIESFGGHDSPMFEILVSNAVTKDMVKYISEIDHLFRMPRSLKLAFELTLHLGKNSYFVREGRHRNFEGGDYIGVYDKRKVDGPAHDLLLGLLKRMKAEDKFFLPTQAFSELEKP